MAIDHEVTFVRRAIQLYGPDYEHHLLTKGFTSEDFLSHWSVVTAIANRYGIGPRVLDLGCGPGWSSIFLAGRGCRVTAGDVAPDMLALARSNAERMGMAIDFVELDIQGDLTTQDHSFDTVLIFDALHHCPDERVVLRNCFRTLRPGGRILLVEPDWFHEYSPGSAEARRTFGTTERGLGYGTLKRSLRAEGFVEPRRFYNVSSRAGGSLRERIKAVGIAALTVTIGFPHRSVIVLAERPEGVDPSAGRTPHQRRGS